MTVTSTAIVERIEPSTPAPVGAITPMEMLSRAVSSGASVEVMERLLALQERYEANEARRAFDAAMADAKSEIPTIFKNRAVDFTSAKGRTNYRHEDLGEIAKTVDPILAKHGLSYRFRTEVEGAAVKVTCIVSHRDGHAEHNTLSASRDESGNKNSIQAVGSTITYLQRYTLKAALGLAASADDDGRASGGTEDASPVTADQRDVLQDLINETGTDIALFCQFLGVEALTALPASRFAAAVGKLQAKKRKQAAERATPPEAAR